jgi:hypothetical protein
MQVTLKKAAELSRAALAAAKAIEPKGTISLSVYSTAEVADVLKQGRDEFDAALARSVALVDAGFAIRDAISTANSAAGVDKLLTKVAAIDEIVARITAAIGGETGKLFSRGDSGDGSDSDDLSALGRRVEQARKDITDSESRRFGVRDEVKINVLGTEQKKTLGDEIGAYKRKRSGLKDELTAINFGTKITISDAVADVLRVEKLID